MVGSSESSNARLGPYYRPVACTRRGHCRFGLQRHGNGMLISERGGRTHRAPHPAKKRNRRPDLIANSSAGTARGTVALAQAENILGRPAVRGRLSISPAGCKRRTSSRTTRRRTPLQPDRPLCTILVRRCAPVPTAPAALGKALRPAHPLRVRCRSGRGAASQRAMEPDSVRDRHLRSSSPRRMRCRTPRHARAGDHGFRALDVHGGPSVAGSLIAMVRRSGSSSCARPPALSRREDRQQHHGRAAQRGESPAEVSAIRQRLAEKRYSPRHPRSQEREPHVRRHACNYTRQSSL